MTHLLSFHLTGMFFNMLFAPFPNGGYDGFKGTAAIGQAVFHGGWHGSVRFAVDNVVGLQFFQRCDEHSGCDAAHLPFQFFETQRAPLQQAVDDGKFPLAFKQIQGGPEWAFHGRKNNFFIIFFRCKHLIINKGYKYEADIQT